MKKLLTLTVITLMLVVFGVATAEAANPDTISVTVTVTAGDLSVSLNYTTWDASTLAMGTSADTGTAGYFIATNDSNNRTETFSIVAGNSNPSGWTPGATAAGDEVFLMEALGGDLTPLTSIDTLQILETGVVPTGTVTFDLKVTVPTATDHGGVGQTIPVTVTAS